MVGSNPDKNYAEQCRYYARTAYDCAKYLFAKASAPIRHSLCWIRCRCSRENINAASTVVMAAATVAIFVAAWLQWNTFKNQLAVLQGQLDEMHRAYEPFNRSADASEQSAKASEVAARAAQQSAEATIRIERPFLHIVQVNLIQSSPKDTSPTIDFQFINAGKTVGILREVRFECRIEGPILPIWPIFYRGTNMTRTLIIPEGRWGSIGGGIPKCELPAPVTESDWDDLADKRKAIIFYGDLKYEGMLDITYTKGFGVLYIFEKQFFGDMNSDAYNYDRQERRPSGPVEIGK